MVKERKINLLLTALPFFLERHYSDSQPKIFTTSFCRGNNLQQHIQMERGFRALGAVPSVCVSDKASPGTSKRGRTRAALPASPRCPRGHETPEAWKPHWPSQRVGIDGRGAERRGIKGLWYPLTTGCLSSYLRRSEHCVGTETENRQTSSPQGACRQAGKQNLIK